MWGRKGQISTIIFLLIPGILFILKAIPYLLGGVLATSFIGTLLSNPLGTLVLFMAISSIILIYSGYKYKNVEIQKFGATLLLVSVGLVILSAIIPGAKDIVALLTIPYIDIILGLVLILYIAYKSGSLDKKIMYMAVGLLSVVLILTTFAGTFAGPSGTGAIMEKYYEVKLNVKISSSITGIETVEDVQLVEIKDRGILPCQPGLLSYAILPSTTTLVGQITDVSGKQIALFSKPVSFGAVQFSKWEEVNVCLPSGTYIIKFWTVDNPSVKKSISVVTGGS